MKPTRGNNSPKWNSTFATAVPCSSSLPGRESSCSAPPACSSAFPPGGQQLRNLTLQVVVSRKADRVLCLSLLDRLVDLRLGEGGVTAEGHLLALRLLPVDLGQQQFLPALCAVDVAWAQLRRQAVAVTIEQEQWMI